MPDGQIADHSHVSKLPVADRTLAPDQHSYAHQPAPLPNALLRLGQAENLRSHLET